MASTPTIAANKLALELDGVVQVLDHNFVERRRIGFTAGKLTEIRLPTLSASDGRTPVVISFCWQPAQASDGPGSGKVAKPVVSKRKALLASNFRVRGLPFDGSFVTRVALPTSNSPTAAGRVAPESLALPGGRTR